MNSLFKVVIEYNSNGELEVKTNTDELVEVIIKDKVTDDDIDNAHTHNEKSINAINTAYHALDNHLNIGTVESDCEDKLIFGYKNLSEALGMGDTPSRKDEFSAYINPIECYGIKEKYAVALEDDEGYEVLDTFINYHRGIDSEKEFHVVCFDGVAWGYCIETNTYVEMRYPKINELTEEQYLKAQEYRGHDEEIDETDVMLLYGKALYIQRIP
jgi:hypothetical protein